MPLYPERDESKIEDAREAAVGLLGSSELTAQGKSARIQLDTTNSTLHRIHL